MAKQPHVRQTLAYQNDSRSRLITQRCFKDKLKSAEVQVSDAYYSLTHFKTDFLGRH